ncbi:PH domain-containing protein [Indiicoccus explosivorum]|uniref:PH domain-containing protein n=1 Tax=Indiicoccus explosivorum TaxID=1917864 RepID=UPI000B43EDCC|nr:PH domain-containing protein [Indiicoccus explosivorum]
MFGKMASDALGLSDIGSVIKKEDYDKVDADDYVMHEDGEKIFFLIKSKSDEYCFTNKALIHVDGANAASKKRTLKRFDYYQHTVSNVALETAGTVDLDVEIKFTIGGQVLSIDVHKKFLAEIKDLYKALIALSRITEENAKMLKFADRSLDVAASSIGRAGGQGGNPAEQYVNINEHVFSWLTGKYEEYTKKDFTDVFEKYILN